MLSPGFIQPLHPPKKTIFSEFAKITSYGNDGLNANDKEVSEFGFLGWTFLSVVAGDSYFIAYQFWSFDDYGVAIATYLIDFYNISKRIRLCFTCCHLLFVDTWYIDALL